MKSVDGLGQGVDALILVKENRTLGFGLWPPAEMSEDLKGWMALRTSNDLRLSLSFGCPPVNVVQRRFLSTVMVRIGRVWLASRLAEEPLGSLGIPRGREQEVDRLTATVHSLVQIGPATLDLHISLIHLPGAAARPQMRPAPHLKLRRLGLDPTENGDSRPRRRDPEA